MKFIKTELRSNLGDVSKNVDEFVKESFTILNSLLKVSKVSMNDVEYQNSVALPVEDYPYFQLDVLTEFTDVSGLQSLKLMAKSLSARDLVTNRRLKSALDYKEKLMSVIEQVTTAYIPLSSEDIASVASLDKQALGNLATFIYYQFGLDLTIDSAENESEVVANINVYQYAEATNMDVVVLAREVEKVMKDFRPTLPVFEEFPELEEEFYDIAGVYVQDFEALESEITAEDVKRVLTEDRLDLEDFIKEIEARAKNHTSYEVNKLNAFN